MQLEIVEAGGTAYVTDFVTEFPVLVSLMLMSQFQFTSLFLLDDTITEREEELLIDLRLVDTEFSAQVTISPSQVTITIEDNDAATDIVVGFEEQSFELSENSGSSTGSVCIAVMDGNIDEQMPSFEMQNVAGFAEGLSDYVPVFPIELRLSGSMPVAHFTLMIQDDSEVEETEDLVPELRLSDISVTAILVPNQLMITITDMQ